MENGPDNDASRSSFDDSNIGSPFCDVNIRLRVNDENNKSPVYDLNIVSPVYDVNNSSPVYDSNIRSLVYVANNTSSNNDANNRSHRRLINIGGRIRSLSKVQSCSTLSVSKCTPDLADIVFDRKELASSTLTEKSCNAKRNRNCVQLPKLDEKCVDAMFKITTSKFGSTAKDVKKLFRIALREKISNARERKRHPLQVAQNEL
ncbi:uncharacterized protein LOC122499690 [Leptopilina heterotoma]|uniref:uncharacterized protein LOC122499690 n=1 Tax=Leptopilina heterotoma TaxID=63436 RepID=UPI001CA9F734|nr:uncharacterized protein LOC122499690 [Leptopilina heterotoma]